MVRAYYITTMNEFLKIKDQLETQKGKELLKFLNKNDVKFTFYIDGIRKELSNMKGKNSANRYERELDLNEINNSSYDLLKSYFKKKEQKKKNLNDIKKDVKKIIENKGFKILYINMDLEEIDDLIDWNLSFNISIEETLKMINRLDLLHLFI